jgi:class 3 adenylate cyclase/tetratricopeptide (TPR) repeat protein
VLFADLVGSTSHAERLDPEDVDKLLGAYHARLRTELERFGGTVEKFVGDAVMALFGAPIAHEDDPERAVRAALAIRDAVEGDDELGLQVRVAVNTGEALITLGARPSEGEGMAAGDVVNTTARLQAAAPVNGILVGETTYRATRSAIDYEDAAPVQAKGKSLPIPVWQVIAPKSRLGIDVQTPAAAPLVGRAHELDLLLAALARARAERETQLVTLVGVPGMGKSRLVYEVLRAVQDDEELIFWRQGRCLPYGDGVTFWALGEMVKAHAGILETDSEAEAARKLSEAVRAVSREEAEWVEGHLRPLAGIGGGTDGRGDSGAEAFAAWRQFFESLADQRPLVLVFEDLHWADERLLDFVEHLVDWSSGVAILVLCTARPELLERRPGWGGGKLNAATVALPRLTDPETAQLVSSLLNRSVMPLETQTELLARAGGNPLYAEQYVGMLAEREPGSELPVPETVQGIIAARLDGLPAEEKELLQNAAVLGKVFWGGALGADGNAIEGRLHALERKDFVRRERRSSVGGETEYGFRHVLVRDVAYAQIPRGERAAKHRAAAEWIESLSERDEDRVEMLAHHYSSALELARSAGLETDELVVRTRTVLREAGDRADALAAFGAAARFYESAIELWPADDPELPRLRFDHLDVLGRNGDMRYDELLEVRDALVALGDIEGSALAELRLGWIAWNHGDAARLNEHHDAAVALAGELPASKQKRELVGDRALSSMLQGRHQEATRYGREALSIAVSIGDEAGRANELNTIGTSRAASGDLDGLADLEESVTLGESGPPLLRIRGYKNLASIRSDLGQLTESSRLHEQGAAVAQRFGLEYHINWFNGERTLDDYFQGRWDGALKGCEELIAAAEEGSPHYIESVCRMVRSLIRIARGDLDGALDDSSRSLAFSRGSGDPQALYPALAVRARALLAAGDAVAALGLADELLTTWNGGIASSEIWVPGLASVLLQCSREDDLRNVAVRSNAPMRWLDAANALADHEAARAADIYAEIGSAPDEAEARLWAARSLVAAGRRPEANDQLERALGFWRSVGAGRYVREGERLLAASA